MAGNEAPSNTSIPTLLVQDAGRACARSFATALQRQAQTLSIAGQLSDQSERLKIWAGDIGVFARGCASADHRLNLNPFVRDAIVLLLRQLCKSLDTMEVNTAIGLGPPGQSTMVFEFDEGTSEDSSPDSISDSSSASASRTHTTHVQHGQEARLQGIIDAITDLHRLTALLRKQEQRSTSLRVQTFANRRLSNTESLELDDLEHYVRWKLGRLFPLMSEFLLQRIVDAVVFRRKHIYYRRRHAEKLRSGTEETFEVSMNAARVARSVNYQLNESVAKSNVGQSSSSLTQTKSRSVLSSTIASSVNRLGLPVYAKSVALSGISTNALGRREVLDIPPRPRFLPGSLEAICAYCSRVVRAAEIAGQRWW